MSQEVGCHKSPVAVSAHADPLGINDAHGIQLVNGCLEVRDDLVDKSIIHGFWVPDDRHLGSIEKGISLGYKEKL